MWYLPSVAHTVEQATRGISHYVNSDKTEFMPFYQDAAILLNGKLLKLLN